MNTYFSREMERITKVLNISSRKTFEEKAAEAIHELRKNGEQFLYNQQAKRIIIGREWNCSDVTFCILNVPAEI